MGSVTGGSQHGDGVGEQSWLLVLHADINSGNNGDVLQGTLGTVSADHFTLLFKTARTQNVAFADVRSIQRANLRTSTRVLLVAGISVAVATAVLFILVIHTLGKI